MGGKKVFTPNLAQIRITRKDPGPDFDTETATRKLARRTQQFAALIVTKNLLRSVPSESRRKSAEKKIHDMIETEERMKTVRVFMESWNDWRNFYYDLPPMVIKNKSQLSTVESCIDFAYENRMDLSILIACVMKNYEKRNYRPNFNAILTYGEDAYKNLYDQVMADIDLREYEERSTQR